MNLEQWAANYGLSAAQFEESVREWAENYKLSVANIIGELNGVQTLAARNADRDWAMNLMNYDLNRTNADRNYELNRTNSDRDWAMNLMNYDLNRTNADRNFGLNEANVTGYYNGRPTMAKTNADRNFDLERTNADRNFRLNEANVTGYYNGTPTYAATKQNTSNLSSIGMSMLQSGIMPSTDMLRAMGISDADAQAYLMGLQAKSASKGGGTYYGGSTSPVEAGETGYNALFTKANELYPNNPDLAMAWIKQLSKAQLQQYGISSAPSDTYLQGGYSTWLNANPTYIDNAKVSDDAKSLLGDIKGITGTGRKAEYIDRIATEANSKYDLSENDVKWLYDQIGYGDYYNRADEIKGKTWDPVLQKFV